MKASFSLSRLLLKTVFLFLSFNLLFAIMQPIPQLGKLSIYNHFVPGRERFPFGENPATSYNLTILQIDTLFASHQVSQNPLDEEFRVFLLGDSSVWGFYLENSETISGLLNQAELTTAEGVPVHFYNLGYPSLSLAKDLLILDYAMAYQPDLILWLVTLEGMPHEKQTSSTLVQNNQERIESLIDAYDIRLDPDSIPFVQTDFWGNTIIGQRQTLSNMLNLQLYAIPWAATGIDQEIRNDFIPRAEDLEASEEFYGLTPITLSPETLSLDIINAGIQILGNTPIVIINEAIFVSEGENSSIRYNYYYPRWTYDTYREIMESQALSSNWNYLDLWQAVENDEFTNSAIHYTHLGSEQLAAEIQEYLSANFSLSND